MSIKSLIFTGAVVVCGIIGVFGMGIKQNAMAFNAASDCPKSSLYKTQGDKWTDKTAPSNFAECNVLPDEDGKGVMNTVTKIINVIVGVVGIVSVAMIVLGGISYATSQGDAAKAKKAQNTILYSVVGLLIALLAFAIVNFVLTSVF